MPKQIFKPNPKVSEIFADLEDYLLFCRNYGYKYDEADLYNSKRYAYQQYMKYKNGKKFRDMWKEDNKKFEQSF